MDDLGSPLNSDSSSGYRRPSTKLNCAVSSCLLVNPPFQPSLAFCAGVNPSFMLPSPGNKKLFCRGLESAATISIMVVGVILLVLGVLAIISGASCSCHKAVPAFKKAANSTQEFRCTQCAWLWLDCKIDGRLQSCSRGCVLNPLDSNHGTLVDFCSPMRHQLRTHSSNTHTLLLNFSSPNRRYLLTPNGKLSLYAQIRHHFPHPKYWRGHWRNWTHYDPCFTNRRVPDGKALLALIGSTICKYTVLLN